MHANPYSVALAISKTSSSVSNGIMVITGPNISSILVLQSWGNPSRMVGAINQPPSKPSG